MYNFMRKLRKHQKGFTLIELLVVVAILGVLAAVVVPNVAKFIGSGTEEAAATELANIQLAMTAYMADNPGTAITPVTTAVQITPGTTILGPYVINSSAYTYTWTAEGVVTQGAKATSVT
ncbi:MULTISPECIES: type II secretion system protein [Dehalococcoides]|jgi:type IV pilus assembly protein PilA|uniref:type II secretion system protein n=1 Tax=Dehalococcoides TaxID=61434 RepID=UPI0004E03417|nr:MULTISPECIES: type II secretion system protein [Dehalococcoides]AII61317.1 general secretion pathway protein [Dehalococcoides mccartyi CG5]OBW61344.1 MAG: general secretion pathway protein [Dehalococcoides mccartyi]